MHPPWINFFFLFLLGGTSMGSAEGERDESDNSTVSRTQRETYERERRLIPYMTYYIAPSLTSRTNPEPRTIFFPVASPRENVYQIPLTPTQNNPQPLIRIQNPTLFPPPIQPGKEQSGTFPKVYSAGSQYTNSEIAGPSVRLRLQPQQQTQSETQPLPVIKVQPVAIQQKYQPPTQIIKIIPLITKAANPDRSPKSFSLPPQQYSYSTTKTQPLLLQPYTLSPLNYYKPLLSQTQNSLQENKLHQSDYPPKESQFNLIHSSTTSDKTKYTLAKIILSTTTPAPYANIKYTLTDGTSLLLPHGDPPNRAHLAPSTPAPEHNPAPTLTAENYVNIPAGAPAQVYYARKSNGDTKQQNLQLPKLRVPLEENIRFVATVTPLPVANDLEATQLKTRLQLQQDNYDKQTLNSISSLLKETNKLPQNLTPHNIDAGIQTLALILERLQQQKGYQPPQKPKSSNSSDANHSPGDEGEYEYRNPKKVHSFPEKSGTSTPGRPGIDYPIYSSIPHTTFDCSTQRYKGFFGDPDTKCQVWHYCDLNGGQASFLCPNGTIFSQVALTCDWWFNVKCASTSQLYVLNERLYKYILPFSPSFPEDFSGPVVDTYLEAKFKEMEAKLRKKGGKSSSNSTTTTETPEITTEATTEDSTQSPNEYQTLRGEGES